MPQLIRKEQRPRGISLEGDEITRELEAELRRKIKSGLETLNLKNLREVSALVNKLEEGGNDAEKDDNSERAFADPHPIIVDRA